MDLVIKPMFKSAVTLCNYFLCILLWLQKQFKKDLVPLIELRSSDSFFQVLGRNKKRNKYLYRNIKEYDPVLLDNEEYRKLKILNLLCVSVKTNA